MKWELLVTTCFLVAGFCMGQPGPAKVDNAITRAGELNTLMSEVNELYTREFADGLAEKGETKITCTRMLAGFHNGQAGGKRRSSSEARDMLLATRFLLQEGYSLEQLQTQEVISQFQTRKICVIDTPVCNATDKYRTANGSCNNLANPNWGRANTQQKRVLHNAYDDENMGTPRNTSVVKKGPLPNPRNISEVMHKNANPPKNGTTKTLHMFQMGQYLAHDLIDTPMANASDCCKHPKGEDCIPLYIMRNDSHFGEGYCMGVVRSEHFMDTTTCIPGIRQQGNAVTSYLDASNVYGSSKSEQDSLRDGAKIKMTGKGALPDDEDSKTCVSSNDTQKCKIAGDHRVSVIPSLTAYHTAGALFHNIIVDIIIGKFPDNETIFQEARRIHIAFMQRIVYNEYLQSFMSAKALKRYGLDSNSTYKYNTTMDSTIMNLFGLTLRLGHVWIPGDMRVFDKKFRKIDGRPTEETFNNPELTYRDEPSKNVTGIDGLAIWLSGENSTDNKGKLPHAVRDALFATKGVNNSGFDLAALNILRGRDHGIPSYSEVRNWVQLSNVTKFEDLADHTEADRDRLETLYEDARDIDAFVGAVTEINSPGAGIGPTLEGIMGMQFKALKEGDRFFYKNPAAGFNEDQQKEIEKFTMSRWLCDTMHFERIQANAFLTESESNPLKKCDEIQKIDYKKFFPAGATGGAGGGAAGGTGTGARSGGAAGTGGAAGPRNDERELDRIMERLLEVMEEN